MLCESGREAGGFSQFVFQNAEDAPAILSQGVGDEVITGFVADEFSQPEGAASRGERGVFGAAVPEAAIDKDGDALLAKDEIGLAEDGLVASPAGDSDSRKMAMSRSSVALFPRPRMLGMTSERFAFVKTLGIIRSDCSRVKFIFLALEETRFVEHADNLAEPMVGAVDELTEMPAAGQSGFRQRTPVNVLRAFLELEEPDDCFAALCVHYHQHHALARKQMAASVVWVVFPHRPIRRERHVFQSLVFDGKSGRELPSESPSLRGVERRVENECGFKSHPLRLLLHAFQILGQILRPGRRGIRESVIVAQSYRSSFRE